MSNQRQNGESAEADSADQEDLPPLTTQKGDTVEDLGIFVDAIRQRLSDLEDETSELRGELDEERAARQRLEEENEELRKKLQEVDQRTDLLRLVKQENAQEPAKRAAVLIQNLINQAQRKRERDESAKASLTAEEGRAALGNSNERTVIYDDFKKAVKAVGDEDVLWYQQESRGSEKKSRLRLNLEAGDLPDEIGGYALDTRRG